jgi:hypothetical protein
MPPAQANGQWFMQRFPGVLPEIASHAAPHMDCPYFKGADAGCQAAIAELLLQIPAIVAILGCMQCGCLCLLCGGKSIR